MRFVVVIRSADLWAEARLHMAMLTAHEYGHHVQEMSGYRDLTDTEYWLAKGRKAVDLVTRRSELQTDCFAAIAVGAVYDSLFSSRHNWSVYRQDILGWDQEASWDRTHGLPRTMIFWEDRGFKERSTGICNTWRSKTAQVK